MTIRPERPEDAPRVRHVNELAFGQPMEADLVERLRQACTDSLSLVADDDAVVGHILFTPVVIENAERRLLGMGLAPMAVLPGHQRQGIGSQLVRRGLDILRERGCPFVVVVGHPEYYPRFGFEPASTHRLASQWDGVPDAAFMVLILDAHAMAGVSGVAKYRDEFSEVALEGEMIERQYLEDCLLQLRKLKEQAEKAIGQIGDEHLFAALDPEANSIAVIMKHMAGNMRSRWTDFLTSDGEKPDRDRDREFELDSEDTRAKILSVWDEGWKRAFQSVSSLSPEDLGKTIRIRGESHSVVEAINRQMTHYAAHVGQIVLLAKHYAGPNWRSLSIPRGKSKEFDVAKSGAAYNVEPDVKRSGA
jgi:predicted N-acetyltransferase YhbS